MIVELFGPPGAGKTTFANLLAARLQERGSVAELVLSYRPAEQLPSSNSVAAGRKHRHFGAMARRVARPVMELFSMAINPGAVSQIIGTAGSLLKILPPRNILSSIRMNQYLTRLSHSWSRASNSSHVALFDQGFIQAICSLCLLNGAEDDELIGHALDRAPEADLLIHLDAPREVLSARLRKRQDRQSRLERWLELDLKRSLKAAEIAERLHGLLHQRGRRVARVEYIDENSLPRAAQDLAERLTAQLGADGDRPPCQEVARSRSTASDEFSHEGRHHG
jgi:thymidylate kinase